MRRDFTLIACKRRSSVAMWWITAMEITASLGTSDWRQMSIIMNKKDVKLKIEKNAKWDVSRKREREREGRTKVSERYGSCRLSATMHSNPLCLQIDISSKLLASVYDLRLDFWDALRVGSVRKCTCRSRWAYMKGWHAGICHCHNPHQLSAYPLPGILKIVRPGATAVNGKRYLRFSILNGT